MLRTCADFTATDHVSLLILCPNMQHRMSRAGVSRFKFGAAACMTAGEFLDLLIPQQASVLVHTSGLVCNAVAT